MNAYVNSNSEKMLKDLEAPLRLLQELPEHAKEHFLLMLTLLIQSFLNQTPSLLLSENSFNDTNLVITSCNLNEADSINLLHLGIDSLINHITEDAPPREMFN